MKNLTHYHFDKSYSPSMLTHEPVNISEPQSRTIPAPESPFSPGPLIKNCLCGQIA